MDIQSDYVAVLYYIHADGQIFGTSAVSVFQNLGEK